MKSKFYTYENLAEGQLDPDSDEDTAKKWSGQIDSLNRRRFLRLAMIGTASAFLLPSYAITKSSASTLQDPRIVRESPQNEANPIRLPDDTLVIYYMERNKHVTSIRSRDNGLTWSEPKIEFTVSGNTGYVCRSLLDHNGETHIWFIQRGEEHSQYPGNRQFDIWHSHTTDNHSNWARPNRIWEGYCGAIRDALQMESGRIVVPFGAWKTGSEALPDETGSNYTTVIYSDDNGASWQQSPAALTSPVYEGYNGNNYGACEPCITQLDDGRIWMLIRTQIGALYESFSDDGINWTSATPSRFASSSSPAAFVKLDDNRIVVLWNNHELPPRVDGNGVYGGRDAMHAAISEDNGQTWQGFREVYLDPTRNETPPRRGDRGTAYPNGEVADDGYIILVTGQGEHARKIIRFHPDWLCEKTRRHKFTSDRLDDWCVYKGIGPAEGWWRDRIAGARLAAHPDKWDAQVLHVRRPDNHAADGATWNFPAGRQGTLTLRVCINQGFGGAQFSLADRLFDPTDDQGEQRSMFQLQVDSEGSIGEQAALTPERWYTVRFEWNLDKKVCAVKTNENPAIQLSLENSTVNGISYLRLRSTARSVDKKGLFVESVEANVE